jgi:hypothetical protein
MTDSTDKVVVGLLTGMEPRSSGWFRFTVQEDGKQYPLRLDTKKPEIIEQCKALMGQRVKALYGEQQSENINPNNGQPYTNRYLNNVAAAQANDVSSAPNPTQQAAQQSSGGSPAATRGDDSVRELRIMRMGASERAVAMLAAGALDGRLAEVDTATALVEAAEVWVAYYVYGAARFGVEAFDQSVREAEQAKTEAPQEQQQLQTGTCEKCGWKDGYHGQGCPNGVSDDDIPF